MTPTKTTKPEIIEESTDQDPTGDLAVDNALLTDRVAELEAELEAAIGNLEKSADLIGKLKIKVAILTQRRIQAEEALLDHEINAGQYELKGE